MITTQVNKKGRVIYFIFTGIDYTNSILFLPTSLVFSKKVACQASFRDLLLQDHKEARHWIAPISGSKDLIPSLGSYKIIT